MLFQSHAEKIVMGLQDILAQFPHSNEEDDIPVAMPIDDIPMAEAVLIDDAPLPSAPPLPDDKTDAASSHIKRFKQSLRDSENNADDKEGEEDKPGPQNVT